MEIWLFMRDTDDWERYDGAEVDDLWAAKAFVTAVTALGELPAPDPAGAPRPVEGAAVLDGQGELVLAWEPAAGSRGDLFGALWRHALRRSRPRDD